jgi:hypothetical protein
VATQDGHRVFLIESSSSSLRLLIAAVHRLSPAHAAGFFLSCYPPAGASISEESTMTVKTANGRPSTWLKSEPPSRFGRERATAPAAGLSDGTVLGRITLGIEPPVITGAPTNANVSPPVEFVVTSLGDDTRPGDYSTRIQNNNLFIHRPDGSSLGVVADLQSGAPPQPFISNELNFTVEAAAGFGANDAWTITITSGPNLVVPLSAPGTGDGSAVFAGICCGDVEPATGEQRAVILSRGPAEVAKSGLIWPEAYATEADRAPVYEAMLRAGIRVMQSA